MKLFNSIYSTMKVWYFHFYCWNIITSHVIFNNNMWCNYLQNCAGDVLLEWNVYLLIQLWSSCHSCPALVMMYWSETCNATQLWSSCHLAVLRWLWCDGVKHVLIYVPNNVLKASSIKLCNMLMYRVFRYLAPPYCRKIYQYYRNKSIILLNAIKMGF